MPQTERYRIRTRPGHVALLASGGLDSSVMLADLARGYRKVWPLYVRVGLIWESHELAVLKRYVRALDLKSIQPPTVLELPMRDLAPKHWSNTGRGTPGYKASLASNYIVGRNLVLLSKAAVWCAPRRIGRLALALLQANPFPDATPSFFSAFERTVANGLGLRLRIIRPYAWMTKAAVIRRGRQLPLALTISCIRPNGNLHCGNCTKCAERMRGFEASGVPDPTRYRMKRRAT